MLLHFSVEPRSVPYHRLPQILLNTIHGFESPVSWALPTGWSLAAGLKYVNGQQN